MCVYIHTFRRINFYFCVPIIRFLMKMVLLVMYELKQVTFRKLLIPMIPHGWSKFGNQSVFDYIIVCFDRYIVSIVICSLTLFVIVVLVFGLILGSCGFKKDKDPQDRSAMSNCGGIILMMLVN